MPRPSLSRYKKTVKPLIPKDEGTWFRLTMGTDPTRRNGTVFQKMPPIINTALRISNMATNNSLKTYFMLNLSDIGSKIYTITVTVCKHVRMQQCTFQ